MHVNFCLRIHQDIHWYLQWPQYLPKAHHFIKFVMRLRLNNQKIHIRIFPGVTTCIGTKQNDLRRFGCLT